MQTDSAGMYGGRPLVTFLVPCYNSAEYMHVSIESLLKATRPVEIIVVNDGSTDATLETARRYEEQHPDVIRVIDQQNAGWGGGVNKGIAEARGWYFKVVDSDDYIEESALNKALATIGQQIEASQMPDLLVTNYVYDHQVDGEHHTIHYRGYFPEGRLFRWHEARRSKLDQLMMIHSSWYFTQLLRECGVHLPEKVCYMDSHLLLHPLPYVRTLYYLDVDAYHYQIGREGQSIDIEVMKQRIDQQLKATYMAIDDYSANVLVEVEPNMAECYMRYFSAMVSVSTIYLFMIGTPEALQKNRDMWKYLRKKNPVLYQRVARTPAGLANRRTALGRRFSLFAYGIMQSKFKFA